MKKILILFVSTFIYFSLSPASFATTCPSADAIKTSGLVEAEKDDSGQPYYYAGQISNYNTPDTWGFVVVVPDMLANSPEQALAKAKEALSTLTNSSGPIFSQGRTVCLYGIASGYRAGAITPINFARGMSKALQFKK